MSRAPATTYINETETKDTQMWCYDYNDYKTKQRQRRTTAADKKKLFISMSHGAPHESHRFWSLLIHSPVVGCVSFVGYKHQTHITRIFEMIKHVFMHSTQHIWNTCHAVAGAVVAAATSNERRTPHSIRALDFIWIFYLTFPPRFLQLATDWSWQQSVTYILDEYKSEKQAFTIPTRRLSVCVCVLYLLLIKLRFVAGRLHF